MRTKPAALLVRAWDGFIAYAVKFGVVGAIGLVLDVAIFNALRLGVFGIDGWAQTALGAKTISTIVAIVFNWIGNRYWTFRDHRRRNYLREFAEYAIVSVGGMGIALACLWVSHHVLGFTNLLADNLASNVVGLGLGTAFRFALYRYWVWGAHRADGLSALARVEEAQRTLFEEPPVRPEPDGEETDAPRTTSIETDAPSSRAAVGTDAQSAAQTAAPPAGWNQGG